MTLRDIGKQLGVSAMTVSLMHVLLGNGSYRMETYTAPGEGDHRTGAGACSSWG